MKQSKMAQLLAKSGYNSELTPELIKFARLIEAETREDSIARVERAVLKQIVWYPPGYSVDANNIGSIYRDQVRSCVRALNDA